VLCFCEASFITCSGPSLINTSLLRITYFELLYFSCSMGDSVLRKLTIAPPSYGLPVYPTVVGGPHLVCTSGSSIHLFCNHRTELCPSFPNMQAATCGTVCFSASHHISQIRKTLVLKIMFQIRHSWVWFPRLLEWYEDEIWGSHSGEHIHVRVLGCNAVWTCR
jgi:hypothetical protein